MKRKGENCKHFNGVQHDLCLRRISYKVNWPAGGIPCIPALINGRDIKPCPFFERPTPEETAAEEAEFAKKFAEIQKGLEVARNWRVKPKPASDRYEVVKCPICEGQLHLSQSAYNGHVHGRCETPDCIAWME